MPRARPMAPELRRQALVDATLPLLYQHGRAVTTKQIAEAAHVAEGTIFRAFASKEELVEEALAQAFAPDEILRRVGQIDATLPLRDRMVALVSVYQQRFLAVFELMRATGLVAPPQRPVDPDQLVEIGRLSRALVEPDAHRLRVPADDLVHRLRLLTFSGSHAEIAHGRLLTPEEIVDTVLLGLVHHHPTEDHPCC